MRISGWDDLAKHREWGEEAFYSNRTRIAVGTATCGCVTGAVATLEAMRAAVREAGLSAEVVEVGCQGLCQREPIVDVWRPGLPRVMYVEITARRAPELVKAIGEGQAKPEWAYGWTTEDEDLIQDRRVHFALRPDWQEKVAGIPRLRDTPFYAKQLKVAMRNCGLINPWDIREALGRGGYMTLARILRSKPDPEDVIAEVKASGLRGRGGGGFDTGFKWEQCRKGHGDVKYVICNADEGDPGAYMDRSVLEGDPHAVLEGMMIGAYAIGCREGFIYVRHEYPQAVEKLRRAVDEARAYGLLGHDILGSGFDFDIQISRGGGAFVCGESTALMASLEGKPGEPRAKYVHTVHKGLWERPSCLNNVETWANVPAIIAKGAGWFSSIGTETSKGTKVFSVVGHIKNTGLVEVPMGITLREILFDICGGMPGKKRLKAVQTGGPSGGCLIVDTGEDRFVHEADRASRAEGGGAVKSLLDLPVDFEQLTEAGSMMGSGGMIVMDEDSCMVDVARFFLDFLKEESCGKCLPCREGIRQMLAILTDICEGRGRPEHVDLLEELSETVIDTSLCALGGSAPNPVLSTIRYFRGEYEAHIHEKRCPAGVCQALVTYGIDPEKCSGCELCKEVCPNHAIYGDRKKVHALDGSLCIKCGACYQVCKLEAVVRH